MSDANNIIVGSANISLDGTDVGYTMGGVRIRYEPTWLDIEADQAAGIVKKARSAERMFVNTTLLEATLEKIRLAFMQPSANLDGSTLTLGYDDACWTDEIAIIVTGKGPNCGTRTFTFSKCVSFGNKEYAMQRDQEVRFEVEFEILKDASGNFGTIVDS